jgi:hypothetical protein
MMDKMKPRLYLDLETVPNEQFRTDPPTAEQFRQEPKPIAKNLKDPDKIEAALAARSEEAAVKSREDHEKALADHDKHFRQYSLYAWKGMVISAAWGWSFSDGNRGFTHEPEKAYCGQEFDVLRALFADIAVMRRDNKVNQFLWCGHNLKTFDLPMLQARALWHRILPKTFEIPYNERPWNNNNVLDTMDEIPFIRDNKKLSWILDVLGLEGKTGGMSGADVYDAWCGGQLEEIAAYNKGDVAAVRAITDRLGI